MTGLAWTEYGGEILKIETVTMPGKGRMQITGKLGDVMQESVKAAKSFVRSKCLEYGIIPPIFEKKDFHIHVPEGATPKDGPSAGIGMVTSIVSSITNIPVKRDVAMTGEVTLTGQVLPIGGLKEKLIAAHRAGIKEVLIPKENEKDLVDMPKKIIDELANLGVFGLTIPEEYGGLGLNKLAMCVVSEELARGYIGVGSLATRTEIASELILNDGTKSQKDYWLSKISNGESIPAACFTEPDSGSDLGSITTKAEKEVLNIFCQETKLG